MKMIHVPRAIFFAPALVAAGCAGDGETRHDALEDADGPHDGTADTPIDGPGDGGDDAACPAGTTRCGGECVDTAISHEHCGGCGEACDPAEVCAAGSCMIECPAGLTECSGGCVDTSTDPRFCGGCTTACEAYETCEDGSCGCEPQCDGRRCGPDGCAGTCPPGCESWETCGDDGQCVESGCFPWSGSTDLQSAVNDHECVEMQPGEYRIGAAIWVPEGHTLRGSGRDATTLGPASGSTEDALLIVNASSVTVESFRATAAAPDGTRLNLVFAALSNPGPTTGIVFRDLRIEDAACDGIDMGGTGTTIEDSVITGNGGACWIGVGGGVYAETGGAQNSVAPRIIGNTIQYNPGTAVDINNVDGGEIRDNTISENGGIAGIAVYQGYGWTIDGNRAFVNGGTGNDAHPRCHIPQPVGIWLCQDEDVYNGANGNTISNNQVAGSYGIILIGADEVQPYLVPRFNTLTGNDVFGSTIGCADDFSPGQWIDGDNTWSGNNCRGTPDSLPDYI